jgi:hypothetical protein
MSGSRVAAAFLVELGALMVIKPIAVSARPSASWRPRHRISPIAATSIVVSSMTPRRRRTAPNLACGPRWSTRFWSSSGCSAYSRAVSWAGEERTPAVRDVRALQPVHAAPPTGVMLAGDVRPKCTTLPAATARSVAFEGLVQPWSGPQFDRTRGITLRS